MIHAFALEPKLVATWGRREEFRFIHDKFGLGTPRVLLELPGFTDWKNAVYSAAGELEFTEKDWKRLEEVFRIFSEHRCRRAAAVYSDVLTWLENAEREHARHEFRAIVATENPRRCAAVLVGDDLGLPKAKLWACVTGATPPRSATELATALSAMLVNCRELHLVDPNFGPENARHRKVLEALMGVLASDAISPDVVRVHCSRKSTLVFFEQEAAKMAARLPAGCTVEFARWKQKQGGEKLHNRYVLTDLGGVSLGVGPHYRWARRRDCRSVGPRFREWGDRGFERRERARSALGERAALWADGRRRGVRSRGSSGRRRRGGGGNTPGSAAPRSPAALGGRVSRLRAWRRRSRGARGGSCR